MMPETEALQNLMAAMVTRPETLRVDEHVGLGLQVRVQTRKRDQPRLIGRGGQTIYALQAIAESMGTPDARVSLTLDEPAEDTEAKTEARAMNPDALLAHVLHRMEDLQEAEVTAIRQNNGTAYIGIKATEQPKPKIVAALSLVFHAIGRMQNTHLELEWL